MLEKVDSTYVKGKVNMKSSMLLSLSTSLTKGFGSRQWFHAKSTDPIDVFGKLFFAVLFYFLICFGLKKLFEKLQSKFEKGSKDKRSVGLILRPVEYALDTIILCIVIVQWMLVENASFVAKLRVIRYVDIQRWLHYQSDSLIDYIFKVIIAFIVYLVITGLINSIIQFILTRVNDISFTGSTGYVLLKVIKYVVKATLIVLSLIQLYIVEYNIIAAVVVIVAVLLTAAYKLRNVNFKSLFDQTGINDLDVSDRNKGRAANIMNSVVARMVGVVILLAIVFFVSRGVNSVSASSGEELSQLVIYPEAMIAKELNTSFKDVSLATAKVPGLRGNGISVRSNGKLNLIVLNKKQVGVNSASEDYLFFGVGTGQTKTKAINSMRYAYEGTEESVVDMTSGTANTYYYYNESANDCLAITISSASEKVVSVTYYTDFKMVEDVLNLDHE